MCFPNGSPDTSISTISTIGFHYDSRPTGTLRGAFSAWNKKKILVVMFEMIIWSGQIVQAGFRAGLGHRLLSLACLHSWYIHLTQTLIIHPESILANVHSGILIMPLEVIICRIISIQTWWWLGSLPQLGILTFSMLRYWLFAWNDWRRWLTMTCERRGSRNPPLWARKMNE
jgi:hypothetical protein